MRMVLWRCVRARNFVGAGRSAGRCSVALTARSECAWRKNTDASPHRSAQCRTWSGEAGPLCACVWTVVCMPIHASLRCARICHVVHLRHVRCSQSHQTRRLNSSHLKGLLRYRYCMRHLHVYSIIPFYDARPPAPRPPPGRRAERAFQSRRSIQKRGFLSK